MAKPLDRLYLLVLIHTVGRIGEINKLKWADIKEDYLVLRSRKARNSDLKERVIPLNKVLKEVFDHIPKKGEYVFVNDKNEGKRYVYRDKFLENLCVKAEVKRFTFHCLRHFGASLLAEKGEPLTNIQHLLGHERATTTDIYLQSLMASLSKTTNKLEEIQ